MEIAQTNTAAEAISNDRSPTKKTRERKQYPQSDHAVRFRIYPTDDQLRTGPVAIPHSSDLLRHLLVTVGAI